MDLVVDSQNWKRFINIIVHTVMAAASQMEPRPII
jgi:hypothetical protein